MSFADKIYMLRNQANLSQAAFAEKLQVSRQTVSKWELGTSYPEIDKLIAISDLFHVSIDYLLKNQEPTEGETNLDRLVLRFLGYAQDMEIISQDLVSIMRDGIIDDDERVRMNAIVGTLNEVSRMIEEMKQGLHNNGIS
ncbi:MAG: helix-turn-helix transcriptional regulator [Lachnospiraceae bacterium]|nr:helix-turn-helix transcriptional regulator [Lachnospiraceae bacterium]